MPNLISVALILLLMPGITWAQNGPKETELSTGEKFDDADLDEFLLDTPDDLLEQDKLSLYGFADFGFRKLFVENGSPWLLSVPRSSSFLIGNLNLYLRSKPAQRWTSLVEIRYTYLPNGGQSTELSLAEEPTQTEFRDNVDPAGFIRIGGSSIQRAWLEYEFSPSLAIRGGHWLTPYGIWNIDHGSPTILAVRRPFLIGTSFMPESQTGIQLHGVTHWKDYLLKYFGTVSNGIGPYSEYADLDENKALGLSFKLETPLLDELTFGAASYIGRETDSVRQGSIEDANSLNSLRSNTIIRKEANNLTFSVDLRLRFRRIVMQSEAISQQIAYTSRGRPKHFAAPGTLEADSHNFGAYVIIGYEFLWQNSTLWFLTEQVASNRLGTHFNFNTIGVTLRPVPSVTFKASVGRLNTQSYGGTPSYVPSDPLTDAELQIAWVF